MPSAEFYEHEMDRHGLLTFKLVVNSVAEAKQFKKELGIKAKALRTYRTAITNEMKQLRAEVAAKRPSAGMVGGVVFSLFGKRKAAGAFRASVKRSLTRSATANLQPYERVKQLIDNGLLQIDAAKVKIDAFVLENERKKLR